MTTLFPAAAASSRCCSKAADCAAISASARISFSIVVKEAAPNVVWLTLISFSSPQKRIWGKQSRAPDPEELIKKLPDRTSPSTGQSRARPRVDGMVHDAYVRQHVCVVSIVEA